MTLAAVSLTTFPRAYSSQAFFQDTLFNNGSLSFFSVFFATFKRGRLCKGWLRALCHCPNTCASIPGNSKGGTVASYKDG